MKHDEYMRQLRKSDGTLWISKTPWKTWKKCPLFFKYLFIDNNPPDDSIEMQFGALFHEFAATFHSRINESELKACTTPTQTVKLFEQLTVSQPVVKRWVENFKLFEAARWLDCLDKFPADPIRFWKPLETEVTIEVPRTGQKLHIDRIGYYDEQSLIVIDYKSGKTFDSRDLRSELTFYNIGVNYSGRYQLPCLWLGAYNSQLNLGFLERVNQRTTTAVYKSIQRFKANMVKGEYLPKPSMFCRWCPRLQKCLEEGVFDEAKIENGLPDS